jgi:hypothetical protein
MALSRMASKGLAFSVLERDRSRDRAWRLCPVLRRTAGQIQEKLCPLGLEPGLGWWEYQIALFSPTKPRFWLR